MVLLADGLYSKTPMIELARSLKMNFIFVAKPSDHKHLTEQLTGLRLSGEVSTIEKTNDPDETPARSRTNSLTENC